MLNLKEIAKDINQHISQYQKNNTLSFVEDTHTYFIKDNNGKIISDLPSVSSVLKYFYKPFDAESTKTFIKCNGDKEKERLLLESWKISGDYSTNMGSRVHYLLEKHLVSLCGSYKEVRKPIFICDDEQINTGDKMIESGKNFINLMYQRGAVLLDTEIVLGSLELGYFGQPDKVWLMAGKDGKIGFVITDWKTNKPKNFEVQWYTNFMKEPFGDLHDTALSHYYIQLPLYGKLLLNMLKGTKYENTQLLGGVIVLLTGDGEFYEHRIANSIFKKVLNMNVKAYK